MIEPERLPDELKELLDAERELEAPAADARSRMLTRLGPLMLTGAIGAAVGAGAAEANTAAELAANSKTAGVIGSGLKAKVVIALIAGALGAVGGAATHAALTANPALKPAASVAVSARAKLPPPVASASTTPPAAPPEVTAAAAAPAPSASAPAPSTSAPSKPSGNATGELRQERLLLERATAALVRGDASSALVALREHARRFPHGELSEEREVLLVRALRAAGQNDSADKRAQDFKQKYPSSLQQGIIDASPPSK